MVRLTRQQRNERKSQVYFEGLRRTIHEYQSELINIFDNAKVYISYEEILRQRQNIINSQVYQSLPRWAKGEINGAFDVMMRLHYRNLIWTVMLDGERITTDDPKLQDRWQDVQEGKGCYAYIDSEFNFIPFMEKDRTQKQLELFKG